MNEEAIGQERAQGDRLRVVVPLLVLALTAAVYAPALWFGFVCDDQGQIVESQPHYTWNAIPSYFSSDVWHYAQIEQTLYYRPVFLLWLFVNSKLFGLDPAPWHAAAIALHLAVTALFYFVALRLTGRRDVSGAAALLFGVHPVHGEVVAWLSAATESLWAVLGLGSILFRLKGRRLAALLLFGVAIFAKETAMILPVLLAACDWLFPARPEANRRERFRSAATTLGACAAIGLVYLGLRIHAVGAVQRLRGAWTLRTVAETLPEVVVFYLRQMVAPYQYSFLYPLTPNEHLRQAAGPFLIMALVLGGLLWLARQSKVFAFCALLLALPLLPVLNLTAFPQQDFVHDRYAYLASAGLCLMVAMAAGRGMDRWVAGRRVAIPVALVALTAAGLAYVNLQFLPYWSNNLALYTHAVEVAPENIVAARFLANELLDEQRYAEALPLLQNLLQSGWNEAYEGIGLCYMGLGDYDRAEGFLYRAVAVNPSPHVAHMYLAEIEERRGHWPEAEAQAREAIRVRPRSVPHLAGYRGELGKILEQEGNPQGALAEYAAEIQEDPASQEGRQRYQDLQTRMAKPSPAP